MNMSLLLSNKEPLDRDDDYYDERYGEEDK